MLTDDNPLHNDAVEAHSCVDDSTDKRLLSKTQLIDRLTAGCSTQMSLSTAYRMSRIHPVHS